MSGALICTGDMTVVGSAVQCSTDWVIQATTTQPLDIDPVLYAGAVAAGFFSLLPLWAAIFGFKSLVNIVR